MTKEFNMTVKKVDLKDVNDNPFREKSALNELSDQFNGVKIPAVKKKTIEQFRAELVDVIHTTIKKETVNSMSFMERADYFRAKLSEAKIEGLNITLGIIIDAASVKVK